METKIEDMVIVRCSEYLKAPSYTTMSFVSPLVASILRPRNFNCWFVTITKIHSNTHTRTHTSTNTHSLTHSCFAPDINNTKRCFALCPCWHRADRERTPALLSVPSLISGSLLIVFEGQSGQPGWETHQDTSLPPVDVCSADFVNENYDKQNYLFFTDENQINIK